MFVFLAAGACGGITPKALCGAVLVTLLHQASLLHDDVVDEATHRRSKPTVNAAWSNKTAVLFGDYLLAKALRLPTQHQDHDLLALIVETSQVMSEGELCQLAHARQYTTTETEEEASRHHLQKKTAHLFGTCLAIGATAADASDTQVDTLRQAGEQLKDDWFDYSSEKLDKPIGMDPRAGYLTLPLIHALQQAPTQKQQEVLQTIKHHSNDPKKQQEVLTLVRQSPGMDYTRQKMCQYLQKALDALVHLVASPYQQALTALIQHII